MTAVETIIFPDSVAVCSLYLAAALVAGGDTTTHVGGRVQHDANFVVLELVDAQNASLVIQRSTIRVDCWVDDGPFSKQNAQDLGQLCRGLLGAMQGTVQAGATIYKVTDGPQGLNDAPDPVTGKRVFSFHVVVSMRGGATLDPSTVVSIPDWLRSADIADAVAIAPADSARNVIQSTADATELTLRAAVGQTLPSFLVNAEDGERLFEVTPIAGGVNGASFVLQRDDLPAGFAAEVTTLRAYLSTYSNTGSGGTTLESTASASTLSVHAESGQTAPLLQLQDEFGETVARVLSAGAISTSATEPADAAIATGECVRWFDSTNGAAKVMFKGKSANGTVVTGSLALT